MISFFLGRKDERIDPKKWCGKCRLQNFMNKFILTFGSIFKFIIR